MPQAFASARIQRKDNPLESPTEDQVARRRHDASPGRGNYLVFPFDRAGGWINRRYLSPAFFRRKTWTPKAEKAAAFLVARGGGRMAHSGLGEHASLFPRENIQKLRKRAVAVRHPVGRAVRSRPHLIVSLR